MKRPRGAIAVAVALLVGTVVSILVLPWDLSALASSDGWASAVERCRSFAAGLGTPDLRGDTLARTATLALETVAMAVLGVFGGAIVALPLAVLASRAASDDGRNRRRGAGAAGWLLRQGARVALDALRGIPDFAWALLFAAVLGANPVTGILAIAVNVGGILGKIFSELWDSVPPGRYQALRSTGARPLQTLLYGVQPLAGRGMLSFLLMRLECAVRNASVIGVVAGGGLGGALFEEMGYDNKSTAATFLLATLVLTLGVDLLANFLRSLLRAERGRGTVVDAQRRRWVAGLATAVVVVASVYWIGDSIAGLSKELRRVDWGFIGRHFGQLLRPDLSPATLAEAARGSVVPLALGFLATLGSALLAALWAYGGSISFQARSAEFVPERRPPWVVAWRWTWVVLARLTALLARGIPEVIWVWILALIFRLGMEAAAGALLLHSVGVLARVFTETVDNIPYSRLEHVAAPTRPQAFLFGAVPISRADWVTYTLFQFEVNVRTGILLGIVGVGGLGFMFRQSLTFSAMDRASTFLLAMVLLTTIIDRISRRLKQWRLGC